MEKISLYNEKTANGTVSMDLYFDEKDVLVFDGHDAGPYVEDYWGSTDYDYFYHIQPQEVEKLFAVLGIAPSNRIALLQAIKDRFGGATAFSALGEFMKQKGIEFEASHWH